MANQRKNALIAAGGFFALLILAAVSLVLFVDVNAHKPRLEAALSDALGMEVRIGGRLGVGLFPGFHITVEDVRIRNRGADVASAKQTFLGIGLSPLLHKEIRVVKIRDETAPDLHRSRPRRKIQLRDTGGETGRKVSEGAEGMRFSLDVAKISLSDAALFYTDNNTGKALEAGVFNLEVSRLQFTGGKNADHPEHLSFAAEFACKEFRKGSLAVSDLKLRIEGKDGLYKIHPVTAARLAYSGPGGKVIADRIALGVDNLAVGGGGKADFFRRISFSGTAGLERSGQRASSSPT